MNVREELMKELQGEQARLQYDGKDLDRILVTAEQVTQASVLLLEAISKFRQTMTDKVDENSADAMKGARHDLVYAWTTAAGAVSMVANVFRIDGDEAYKRAVEAVKINEVANLQGL